MSSDRETMSFPEGWSAYKAGSRWYFCTPNGNEVFHVDPGLCEPEFREFIAALHHPADEEAASRAPVGLVDGELSRLLEDYGVACRNSGISYEAGTHGEDDDKREAEEAKTEIVDLFARLARSKRKTHASSTQPERHQVPCGAPASGVYEEPGRGVATLMTPGSSQEDVTQAGDTSGQTKTRYNDVFGAIAKAVKSAHGERTALDISVAKFLSALTSHTVVPNAYLCALPAGDASGGVDVAALMEERDLWKNRAAERDAECDRRFRAQHDAVERAEKAEAAIRALSPQSAPLGREDAGAGHTEEAVGSEGLVNEIPAEVFNFYDRKAKNLSNLWANATPAARQAILVGLLKAWKSGHARGLEIFKELSAPPTDKAGAAVGGRDAALEEAAQVADRFTCGACGMDGKAGKAIRALKSPHPDDGSVEGQDQDQGGRRG